MFRDFILNTLGLSIAFLILIILLIAIVSLSCIAYQYKNKSTDKADDYDRYNDYM